MPCRSSWEGSPGCGAARAPASPPTMSIPPVTRPRRKGCARSTPVSRSAIVTPRPSLSDSPMFGRSPKPRCRQETRAQRRRICRPHGIHARDVRGPFEERDPARVERGREAVDGSRVTELGLDDDALDSQPCDEKLLSRERALRPLPLLLARRQASGVADAVCERGCLEQDDHALADRDARTLGPGKPLPARFSLGCQAAAVTSGRDEDGRRDDRQSREHERVSRLTRWTRTHRAQDSGDTGWDP